jgi:hypothetical protein
MTIYSRNGGSTENIPFALEKLEELKEAAGRMGGEVPIYVRDTRETSYPVIEITENRVCIRLDVVFPLMASECTPQSSGQAGGNT